MKKLLLATALVALPLASQAQNSNTLGINVPCGETMGYYSGIATNGLNLLITGQTTITDANGSVIEGVGQIFLHPDNGDLVVMFTAPTRDGSKVSCILSLGKNFEPYTGPQPNDQEPGEPS